MLRKILLVSGILSTLLYIFTDIIASTLLYPGYSYTSQQVSELSAIGAPTKPLWVAMSILWSPLVIAFGIGVGLLPGQKRSSRATGILLIMWAVVGLVWLFFPMHQPGTVTLASDAMHLIFGVAQVLIMVLFIAFGAAALGWSFRLYSIVTIVALIGCGAFTSTQAPAIAAGQSIPWLGVIERVSVYMPMLWVLIFAIVQLYPENESASQK